VSAIASYALHNVFCQVMSIVVDSGTFRFFGTRGELPKLPPLVEIMDIRKSQSFIEFCFVWHNNLKFIEY
jgi:hypothetical protein